MFDSIRKTKSSELISNENKENCSLPVVTSLSSNIHDKNLTNETLHLNIPDQSLLIYDLNESTTRDLSIITHSPHKVCIIVTNEMHCMSARHACIEREKENRRFLIKNDYDFDQLSDTHHDIHLLDD